MNAILQNTVQLIQSAATQSYKFDATTWGIIASMTVIFGYIMLRSNR